MAKNKRRQRGGKSEYASLEATAKRLHSLLITPEISGFVQAGALRGIREKLVKINFQTIRNVIDRIPLANAIIAARCDQVIPYCTYGWEKNKPGFKFVRNDRGHMEEKDDKRIENLIRFIEQTGFHFDDDREDDFTDYATMFVRETMVIDQVATELQRNRKGEVIAFWGIDGATIKRTDPTKRVYPKNIKYVQEWEQKIYNKYTADDMLFDYKNKRADIRFRGFGYSPVEQCIDMITTLLFGYNYIRDQLLRDRVPKGFIQVMGDVGQVQLDAIRRYWYSAMSGSGGLWNIPILPSGKDGVGIDFKPMGYNNRDMEYHKLMMFLSSIVAACFGIDLAELGIKADDSTALIGESSQPRIESSKNRGLYSMLMFLEQHINKILRKITEDYRFIFVGIEKEDEQAKYNLHRTQLDTIRTINELREEEGLEKIEEEYADIVLNPQAIQIRTQAQMQEQQMQQMMGMMGGQPGQEQPSQEGEEQPAEDGSTQPMDDREIEGSDDNIPKDDEGNLDWDQAFSKSMSGREKVIRIVIE